jgi:hypothetical protein
VRDDLPKGYAAAQALHAGIDYAMSRADAQVWHKDSNTLVVLKASPAQVDRYSQQYNMVRFTEPDLDGALTAAAGVFDCEITRPFRGLSLL